MGMLDFNYLAAEGGGAKNLREFAPATAVLIAANMELLSEELPLSDR